MNPSQPNNSFIAIGTAVLLLVLLIVASVMMTKQQITTDQQGSVNMSITPSGIFGIKELPRSFQIPKLPKSVTNLPTVSSSQGYGVDTNSLVVKNSEKEIQKLAPVLPYSKEFTTTNGVPVSIDIPSLDLQDNAWTLLIQISGIDYRVDPQMNSYMPMKTAFKDAAQSILEWMQKNGVDTTKIVIQWGDKRFIEDRAEQWLQSP